jgi:hypothetical protein
MTILFVIPLIRVGRGVNTHWKRSKLYDLTKRSLIASTVCLVASFANALGAVIMKGQQRGYLCMMCCTIDVTINVLTIHWVTTPSKVKHQPQCAGGVSQISTSTYNNSNNNSNNKATTSGSNGNDITSYSNSNLAPSPMSRRDSILGALPPSPSVSISIHHQEYQDQEHPPASLYSPGSSISIQDSQCSTKSLTKSPII